MSPHYDFDAPGFQKVVPGPPSSKVIMAVRRHASGEIREHIVEFVRMFAGVDVDFHRALEPLQLISSGIGDNGDHQRWLAAIHRARVLKDE